MNLFEITKLQADNAADEIFKVYEQIDFTRKDVYACWLGQSYYYVYHTVHTLKHAVDACTKEHQQSLREQFLEGIKEEKGHEKMIENDLKALGYKVEDFPETLGARNLYQSCLHQIVYWGPEAIIGDSLALEGLACNKLPMLHEQLNKLYGSSACSFLREHCILDVEHYNHSLDWLKQCPEETLWIIRKGIHRVTELYIEMLKEVIHYQNSTQANAGLNLNTESFSWNSMTL